MLATHHRYMHDCTVCPPERTQVLEALKARYALGLLSNFDSAETGLKTCHAWFTAVLQSHPYSEAIGYRKPRREAFLQTVGGHESVLRRCCSSAIRLRWMWLERKASVDAAWFDRQKTPPDLDKAHRTTPSPASSICSRSSNTWRPFPTSCLLSLTIRPFTKIYLAGEAHPPVVADQFVCIKADFRSQHAQLLRPDDQDEAENVAFALPLVLPRRPGPFERAIIILHGLNESEYRKFFPWACTLASAGFPVVMFPMTSWSIVVHVAGWVTRDAALFTGTPGDTGKHRRHPLQHDLERTAGSPSERLFLGADRATAISSIWPQVFDGTLMSEDGQQGALVPRQPFAAGTRVDFLAYSIGGYLTLGLLLGEGDRPDWSRSRAVIFAAGAPFHTLTASTPIR